MKWNFVPWLTSTTSAGWDVNIYASDSLNFPEGAYIGVTAYLRDNAVEVRINSQGQMTEAQMHEAATFVAAFRVRVEKLLPLLHAAVRDG